jgi:hypothetical protein
VACFDGDVTHPRSLSRSCLSVEVGQRVGTAWLKLRGNVRVSSCSDAIVNK